MALSNQINVLTKGLKNMEIDWLTDDDFVVEESDSDQMESRSERQHYAFCILSIDIGIKHLGLSVTLLNNDYSIMEIIWIDLIDIQKFIHKDGPNKSDCKLQHTKTFCDWINHVFQENAIIFERADAILIERQPPIGLVGIEQLIFSRWRDKAVLISPNSMHKFFRIGHYDYEQRKVETVRIALKCLDDNSELVEKFGTYERKHDIADTLCMMLFWIDNKNKEQIEIKRKNRIKKMKVIVYDRKANGYKMNMNDWFEQFRYTSNF